MCSHGFFKKYVFFFLKFSVCSALLLGFTLSFGHFIFRDGSKAFPVGSEENKRLTVVIDAGHGGRDGGAVAEDGTLEKHLNLAVAKELKALLESADPNGEYKVLCGREGRPGKRTKREIGVHSLRGGTVAGEHSVMFYGPMEEIELRHRADSREIFARGALRAAQFAVKAKPGLYTVDVVLLGG